MAKIYPFKAIRPRNDLADKIAALPYDVYNRKEAYEKVKDDRYSFLRIDRPETQFPEDYDMYAPEVYNKANELLNTMIQNGEYIEEDKAALYIYELIMNGRSQIGIVACADVSDYENNIIKKHENTREEKEIDRIKHVDVCNAQTGPIFLAYRNNKTIENEVNTIMKTQPIYDFVADDGITHRIWTILDEDVINNITLSFRNIESIYIADGHHRCASAVKVSQKRRSQNPTHTGTEEYNHFLSVLFPDSQLMIMDYNRVVKSLNGYTETQFLDKIKEVFTVQEMGTTPYHPECKGQIGMYLDQKWYCLTIPENRYGSNPVDNLDVAILQNDVLDPILNIQDPKTDKNIDFVGGIRGLSELEKRVHSDCKVAFAMFPTNIHELFDVSDAGLLMPPKSTWFEPKLRSGLFIHKI